MNHIRYSLCVLLALGAGHLMAQGTQARPDILATFKTGADGERVSISSVCMSADGSRTAIVLVSEATPTSTTVLYDSASGKRLDDLTALLNTTPRKFCALSPDGKRAAVMDSDHKTLRVVELANGQSVYHYKGRSYGYPVFLPDGRLLHSLVPKVSDNGRDARFGVAELSSGKIVGELKIGQWDNSLDVFSPDGTWMLTADGNTGKVKVWDLASFSQVCELEMANDDSQGAIMFLPGTRTIQGANGDGVIQSWDGSTGKRLSRVEPPDLIKSPGAMRFTPDGKTLLISGFGPVAFRDCATGKSLGLWSPTPNPRSIPHLDTLRGNSLLVSASGNRGGDLTLVRLPDRGELTPALSPEQAREASRRQLAPSASEPVVVPSHTAADLDSPLWWLDRAEAEWNAEADLRVRERVGAWLIWARVAAGDDIGIERMISATEALRQKQAQGWSPLDDAKARVTSYKARKLVRAGKLPEALELAKPAAGSRPELNRVLSDVAVEQAATGDIEGSLRTMAPLDKGLIGRTCERAVRVLLNAGEVEAAKRMAELTPDESWRGQGFARLAEAAASAGKADAALAALIQVTGNARIGANAKVIAAFAKRPDDKSATKVIEALPAEQQLHGWTALANAQLERGDVDAAIATSAKLIGNQARPFEQALAIARARLGQTKQAIAAVEGDFSSEVAGTTFAAFLEYRRLDAAAELLKKLPPQGNQDRDSRQSRLAKAFADADRIADAEAVLPPDSAPGSDERVALARKEALWAIAGAHRRAGSQSGYLAVQKPLLDAVSHATGAPSLLDAQMELLVFCLATDDFGGAESLVVKMDPQSYKGTAMHLAQLLGRRKGSQQNRPRDPARARAIARLLVLILDRTATRVMFVAAAGEHIEREDRAEWLDWAHNLPSTVGRVSAYQAMAGTVLPEAMDETNE